VEKKNKNVSKLAVTLLWFYYILHQLNFRQTCSAFSLWGNLAWSEMTYFPNPQPTAATMYWMVILISFEIAPDSQISQQVSLQCVTPLSKSRGYDLHHFDQPGFKEKQGLC